MHTILKQEDYTEPRCLLAMDRGQGKPSQPIPVGRVLERFDLYAGQNDYAAAERHLLYWRTEAKAGGDTRGELAVVSELMGLYRKLGRGEEALQAAAEALTLVEKSGLSDTVTHGTTLINAATVKKAFGEPEAALPLFEAARTIYEKMLPPGDSRLGGLYNNMALALQDLRRFAEARELYRQALSVMKTVPRGELEQAITCLNLADCASLEKGPEAAEAEIAALIQEAEGLLRAPSLPHDGYYAFVLEKCAPSFRYYGYFAVAQELLEEAERIYAAERSRT